MSRILPAEKGLALVTCPHWSSRASLETISEKVKNVLAIMKTMRTARECDKQKQTPNPELMVLKIHKE